MTIKGTVYVREKRPGQWQLRAYLGVKSDGKPRYKYETVRGDESSARARAKDLEASIIRGEIDGHRGDSLGAFATRYITLREAGGDVAPSTLRGYRQCIARIPERLASRPIGEIKPRDLERLYLDLLAKPLDPLTVRHTHTVISMVLDQAATLDEIPSNPAKKVRPPRAKHKAASEDDDLAAVGEDSAGVIRRQHVAALLDSYRVGLPDLNLHPNAKRHALFFTAYMTGMRRGEILGLRWRDVDLDVGLLSVRRVLWWPYNSNRIFKPPKTAHGRRAITLSPVTVATLISWRDELTEHAAFAGVNMPELVFPDLSNLGPLRPDRISNAFSIRMRKIGSPVTSMHALRHTHASELLAAREPVHVVSRRLGHADVSITLRIYAHAIPGSDASVASRIDEILDPQKI